MHKNLLNGLALMMLLSACGGATPHITVVCEENNVGNSIVKWETKPALQGEVKIFASTDPDHIPEVKPVATADIAGQWTTVVTDDPAKRHYYTLLFNDKYRVRVATRNVNVPGVQNFRDLGGYPIYSRHKRVRWGMLYRSAQIDVTQSATLDKLNRLGIRTIIDLRDTSERPQPALPPPTQPRIVQIPIPAGCLTDILTGIDRESIQSDTVYRIVERINRHIVAAHASAFRRVFDVLLDEDNYPAVIHCTTGKGRTGIATALVLSALGVNKEDIMEDYRLSNRYFDIPSATSYAYELPTRSQEALTTVYSAREGFLDAARNEIESTYGSVDEYLTQAVGLQKEEVRQLRKILLVDEE
ncbi:MAG TPA: tyrosine-protein phosphatase [Candidatus Bacteroides merdigallinarum]|uniref:Tyrosine-protein phosphatase n=1 Tax=Candidatus Bacteroides merdigallinarum TaxID=2838473 RepID=A0A9D2J0W7_9BACE|nr:tyrosine-protein phosphatase [Candidatus Bacteroides merdigallinarum]